MVSYQSSAVYSFNLSYRALKELCDLDQIERTMACQQPTNIARVQAGNSFHDYLSGCWYCQHLLI